MTTPAAILNSLNPNSQSQRELGEEGAHTTTRSGERGNGDWKIISVRNSELIAKERTSRRRQKRRNLQRDYFMFNITKIVPKNTLTY